MSFYSYEPEYVQYLTPWAIPKSRHFVQNLAYLCSLFGAAGIGCANPAKVINSCKFFVDIPFNELFERVDKDNIQPETYYFIIRRKNKTRILRGDKIDIPTLAEENRIYKLNSKFINKQYEQQIDPEANVSDEEYLKPLEEIFQKSVLFYYSKYHNCEEIELKYLPCITVDCKDVISLKALKTIFYNEVCE